MKTTGEWIAMSIGSGIVGGATGNPLIGVGIVIVGASILSVLDKISACKGTRP